MNNTSLFDFLASAENISLKYVSDVREWLDRSSENAVFLYGAGTHLPFVISFFRKYGIPVNAILESERGGAGQSVGGIPLIKFSDFLLSCPGRNHCRFFISAPSAAENISKTLREHFPESGIDNFETQLYLDFIPDIEEYRSYLLANHDQFGSLADTLADDLSRRTLECVLMGRLTGNISFFEKCAVGEQYYPEEIIRFNDSEVMAELGSNDGQTLSDFISHCPKFKAAYCFEPERRFLPKLDLIRSEQAKIGNRIEIIQKGAWDKKETLRFAADASLEMGVGSLVLNSEGGLFEEVETDTVDSAIPEPITFLKMDIEGAELRALHGAENQIKKNRPKLAVCVYHKPTDILDIRNYLHSLVPEYRFYLRHHNRAAGTETVLYATADF